MLAHATLPADPLQLRQFAATLLARIEDQAEVATRHQQALAERDAELARRAEIIVGQNATIEALKQHLAQLRRWRFGKQSEQLSPDQLLLWQEGLDQDIAAAEQQLAQLAPPAKPAAKRQPKRTPLPPELPRVDCLHDLETCTCGQCGIELTRIGEEVSEQLDYIPARFQVRRHIRPKYACRQCDTVVSAPMPAQVIDKGLPSASLLAQVLAAKYLDHQPLYRQSGIYGRLGVELPPSTLCGWVGQSEVWLLPLVDRLTHHLLAGRVLHADETTVPVIAPGKGRTATGYLWAYHSQGDALHPIVVFDYAPDRKKCHPQAFLQGWSGTLQVDGYSGYAELFRQGRVEDAYCWAHCRRKLFDINETAKSPVAQHALATIAQLYAIEAEIKTLPAADKAQIRQQRAGPILAAFQPWLTAVHAQLAPGSGLAKAILYTLKRWPGLVRYLTDGDLAIDNNPIERAIRGIALGRKNWLHAGSDAGGRRAAMVYSLLETAKLNGLEPYAWLADVLEKLPTWPASRIDELLPFKPPLRPS
jgi:transposase